MAESFFSVCGGGYVINNPIQNENNVVPETMVHLLKTKHSLALVRGHFSLLKFLTSFFFSIWFLSVIPGEYIMGKNLIILKNKIVGAICGLMPVLMGGFSH
jgi:hypothetical protein